MIIIRTDVALEWDPADDNTPMPFGAKKKYDAEKRKRKIIKWGSISSLFVLALGVAIGVSGWTPF